MKSIIKILAITTAIVPAFMFSGCIQGKYEMPEVDEIPAGDTITITRLWEMYDSLVATGGGTYKFTEDCSVYGYITMSDKIGNIYKSAYLQGGPEDDKAINLHLLSTGGVYEGDYVRVYLKGLVLGDYSGMIQLDSVHVDNNITKLDTHRFLEPEIVGIESINTNEYVGKLVKLTGVQFQKAYVGTTYADKPGKKTVNTYIEDELDNTLIVRTSGYASFAGDTIPRGSGSLVAIVGKYNTEYQMYIRNTSEVQMTNRRFGEVDEIFAFDLDDVATGEFSESGWQNIAKQGTAKWMCTQTQDGNVFSIGGKASEQNETWLITPEITLVANSMLSFKTRMITAGNSLKAMISTDGGENWNEIPANIATSTDWAISGNVSLAQYSGNVRIAFKFESPVGIAGKFFIDDFVVFQ